MNHGAIMSITSLCRELQKMHHNERKPLTPYGQELGHTNSNNYHNYDYDYNYYNYNYYKPADYITKYKTDIVIGC